MDDQRYESPSFLVPVPYDGWPEALERVVGRPGQIRAVFQPIVDLKRGTVCGYEMLARFSGPPERPPDIWFREAEVHGAKVELEARMVEAGLEARDTLPPNCFLTINVDPASLDEPRIRDLLDDRADLANIVIELTEHSRADDELIHPILSRLRDRGAKIAIDDVGTGYSGLARVAALRPDFIKIDHALVSGLHEEPARREMVESLGAVANRIDAWVVAEGIEERAELEVLMGLGVPLGQGFGLARPEPAMIGPTVPLSEWIEVSASAAAAPARDARPRLWQELAPIGFESWEAQAESRFGAEPELSHLPVVDAEGRPVGLVERRGFYRGDRGLREGLCALAVEHPAHLARRALARPARSRLDPVICCDELGRYLGAITIEAMTEALAARLLAVENR